MRLSEAILNGLRNRHDLIKSETLKIDENNKPKQRQPQ